MRRLRIGLTAVTATIALAVGLSAVSAATHAPSTEAAQSKGPLISTAKTSLGQILVDTRGRTLYLFKKDRNGKSTCYGPCATAWPPLLAAAKPRVARGAKAALVGTTRRTNGRLQATYRGQPLYFFIQDTKRGQTKGQGLDGFGARWYVLSPAGKQISKL
jgi:predicted lipoprotein with Yx(FWY)xxD motif